MLNNTNVDTKVSNKKPHIKESIQSNGQKKKGQPIIVVKTVHGQLKV